MDACIEDAPSEHLDTDSEKKRPGLWRVLWSLLLYLLVVPLVVGLLFGFGRGVALGLSGHTTHLPKPGPLFQQWLLVVSLPCAALVSLWYVHRHWRAYWRDGSDAGVGYRRVSAKTVLMGAGLGVLAQLLGILLTTWIYHGHPPGQQTVIASFRHMPTGLQWSFLPTLALLVPVVEETLFRGVLLSGLIRHMPRVLAAVLVSLLFVLAHLPGVHEHIGMLSTVALLATVVIWLRIRTRSIYPGMAAHMACNAFVVFALLGAHH